MPSNLSPFFFERDLKRWGLSGAIQLRPSDRFTVTIDGLYTKSRFIEQQTGLAYDFSGGTLVEQVVEGGSVVNGVQTGGEAAYRRYVGGFVDEISQFDASAVPTDQLGDPIRSEERGVGKECVSTCRSRGSQIQYKNT